jgi:glutamate--cysteine ligase
MISDRAFEKRLAGVINSRARGALQGGLKGVERESLRVTPAGQISSAPHPRALGSALTNEHVTTDYSEALIELVTPPFAHTWELVQYLADLHRFVYTNLPDDELLWATSMPCAIKGDASIPIAQFGSSNVGRMKTVYRNGLGHRYGRVMQAIAGPTRTSPCCAITGGTAGSCCTSSATRRRCAPRSCRDARSMACCAWSPPACTRHTPPRCA